MKTLKCRDAGFDCNAEIRAATDEEVLAQAAQHADAVHGVRITPKMAEHIQTLIREEA